MTPYLDLLRHILDRGTRQATRTVLKSSGHRPDALSVFGYQMRFDLAAGFPLLTTKKLAFGKIAGELLWFLAGDTNIRTLLKQDIHIWSAWPHERYCRATGDEIPLKEFERRILGDDAFAARWGGIGPAYGRQWRAWPTADGGSVDQIAKLLADIGAVVADPQAAPARRLIVSAWNAADVGLMSLPPCHTMFQFHVAAGRLSCQLYQRSADVFLGVPWNIASYALLTHLIARETGLQPGDFVHTFGDVHIYENHVEQVRRQLERTPKPLPTLVLAAGVPGLFEIRPEHLRLDGYDPHPNIPGEVAV